MNYAIELEYFVSKNGVIVPAYQYTDNLDGNPVVGELRTKIHSNKEDLVFELKKLIYLEEKALNEKGVKMELIPSIKVDDKFLYALRRDKSYINRKSLEILDEKSVYDKKVGKLLPRGQYKASLQINFSQNETVTHTWKDKNDVTQRFEKMVSNVFDYSSHIKKWDKEFSDEISKANRVSGVYAIKDGVYGNRIEYRSLPNTVSLDKLIEVI